MQGFLTRLVPAEDEDFTLVSTWLRPSYEGALGAGGESEFYSSAQIRSGLTKSTGAMVETLDGRKVGYVQWRLLKHGGSYEIGGMIGDPKLWDSGCGAEASLLVLDYLFHAKNAHRVQFMTGTYNRRVINFLIKSEVVIEGVLRDYFFVDGEYHDAVVASLLRDEYYAAAAKPGAHPIFDMIPAEERTAGRAELREHLRTHWDSFRSDLVDRG
ncbi:GNAT family N-acetyltransferase [Kitasatospora sp. NPDC054939]|jgi:RimJ/RimL family protein N-acetyltransferase